MSCDNSVVSSRQRSGPRSSRAEPFVVLEDLPSHGQEGAGSFATFHAKGHEQLDGRLYDNEYMSRGQHSCSMVQRLVGRSDLRRHTAEGSGDFSGDPHGGEIALDRKNFAFERGNADAGERLERMHRAGSRTTVMNGMQRTSVERAASVQDDFPVELLGANSRELFRYIEDHSVRSGD